VNLDPAPCQLGVVPQQVFGLAQPARCEGGRVFEQEQGGRSLSGGDLTGHMELKCKCAAVGS
jgi:hypothetical protein